MSEILNLVLSNWETVISILVSIVTILIFCKRAIKNAINSIYLSNSFYLMFGETPSKSIKNFQESVKAATDTMQVRQGIVEQYIEIGVFICESKSGKCIFTNDFLQKLFGLDSSEMKGNGWLAAIVEEERAMAYKRWKYAVDNNIPYDCSYHVKNERDNKLYKVYAHATSVLDEIDNVVCYVGYITVKSSRELEEDEET